MRLIPAIAGAGLVVALLFGARFLASIGLRAISNASQEYQDSSDFVYITIGAVLLALAAGLVLSAIALVIYMLPITRPGSGDG